MRFPIGSSTFLNVRFRPPDFSAPAMQILRLGGRFWAETPGILHLHRCSARGFAQSASGYRPGVSTFLAFSLENRGVKTQNCMAGAEKSGGQALGKTDVYGASSSLWGLRRIGVFSARPRRSHPAEPAADWTLAKKTVEAQIAANLIEL